MNTFGLLLEGIKTSFYDLVVTCEAVNGIGGMCLFYCIMQLRAEKGNGKKKKKN